MSQSYELTTPPISDETADVATAELFSAARQTLGFVPETYRSMARTSALLEIYRMGYARIRSGSFTGPFRGTSSTPSR